MLLKLNYSDVGAYSLAAQQNSYRLFKGMKLICEPEEDNEHGASLTSPAKFLDVIVRLECDLDVFAVEEWHVSSISEGRTLRCQSATFRSHINICLICPMK